MSKLEWKQVGAADWSCHVGEMYIASYERFRGGSFCGRAGGVFVDLDDCQTFEECKRVFPTRAALVIIRAATELMKAAAAEESDR